MKKRILSLALAAVLLTLLAACGSSNDYPDEVVFNNAPITRFFDMTRDDVIVELGEPDNKDSDDYDRYGDKGIDRIYYAEGSGKVMFIRFKSGNVMINGKTLDKSSDDVMNLLSSSDRMITGLISVTDDSKEVSYYSSGNQYFRYSGQNYTLDFVVYDNSVLNVVLYTSEWNWD